MTYAELLPIYQQQTGLAGSDDAFNQWVQGLIDASGSQTGIDGIPQGFVSLNPTQPVPQFDGSGNPTGQNSFGTALNNMVNQGLVGNTNPANSLVGAANNTLLGGINRANAGGNTNQVQGGLQTGGYTSGGTTENTGTQTGTQSQSGTQNTTGTTTGTTTTAVNDPYGLGGVLQNLMTSAPQVDADRTKYLTGVMQNGDPNLQAQTDQAVRNSLTGAQMTGAGDSARARASGYAAADIARNSQQAQLAAAQQLASGGQQQSLLAAAQPFLGQTTTTDQSTTGSVLNKLITDTTQNTDQKGSTTNTGQATGSSLGVATGQVPQQTTSGGGCFVCTAYVKRGEMHRGAIRRGAKYKLSHISRYETSLYGYSLVGPTLAKAVLASSLFARAFRPFARAVLYEEVRLSAPSRLKRKLFAILCHVVFDRGFQLIGLCAGSPCFDHYDARTVDLLESEQLMFRW